MFAEKDIVYFDPFYFKNGNKAKPKYFVVLKSVGEESIIASLPTRNDHIPEKHMLSYGCVEVPEININCFVISSETIITECGKTFDFPTHIYGSGIDSYEKTALKEIYPIKGTDFTIWGRMTDKSYNELITCLSTSKSVKRKYKKILSK